MRLTDKMSSSSICCKTLLTEGLLDIGQSTPQGKNTLQGAARESVHID